MIAQRTKTIAQSVLRLVLVIAALACVCLGLMVGTGCASKGVVEPSAKTDAGGTTLTNPPPNTVTVQEPSMGTWAATGASPVKATRASTDGVSHLGTGVGRQVFIQTGTLEEGGAVIAIGSESDITGRGLVVKDPSGERVIFEAQEFTTATSEPVRAHAEALVALEGIVRAIVDGQRDVALAELEAQRGALEALAPGLFEMLVRLVGP